MVSSATELLLPAYVPVPGFKEHPPGIRPKPLIEYTTHPVFRDVSRQITDALQPENYLQYGRVLERIGSNSLPIMQHEVTPALRVLERRVLLENGFAWTPEMSVYFLKRAGGRLAVVELIYREARKKYKIDQNLLEADSIRGQAAQNQAELQSINQALASLTATDDGELKLALEVFAAEHSIRNADREELGRLYGLISDKLLKACAVYAKIEAFSQPDVDRLLAQTRKEIVTDNAEIQARPFLTKLDKLVETRMTNKAKLPTTEKQELLHLMNVMPSVNLATIIADELRPKEGDPWDINQLQRIIEKNQRIKEVLVGLLLRKRQIADETSPVFVSLEAELKRARAAELDSEKTARQKDLTERKSQLEKTIQQQNAKERDLREQAEVLDAVTTASIGKIIDEVVEDYLVTAKAEGEAHSLSASQLYQEARNLPAGSNTEKADIEKLLKSCWENLKDTLPADKTAAVHQLIEAPLNENLPDLQTRFKKLVALLGEYNTGWVTTYETEVDRKMSNVTGGGLFWNNSFKKYEMAAAGRTRETDITTGQLIDECFSDSGPEFSRIIKEAGTDGLINRKMNAVVALAAAVECVRAYGARLETDRWRRRILLEIPLLWRI